MDFKIGPFVKWAEGKKQLLDRLKTRLPKSYETYYEPFIGGGAKTVMMEVTARHNILNSILYKRKKGLP